MRIKFLFFQLLQKISPLYAVQFAANLFAAPARIPRPPHENELIKQAERFIFKNGLVSYVFKSNQFQNHHPILLVHGWEGRGTQLATFAKPLTEKGYAVYAVDFPGHGESPGKQTTPVHYAAFIKSLARELGPLKAVISHSFGAGCTVLAASDGLDVEKLILIAGPDRYARVVGFFCDRLLMTTQTRELFFREVTMRVGMTPEELVVSELAKNIKSKILVVHDRNDKAVAFMSGESIHAAVPSSQFLITEGLGHRRILKDPKVVKAVSDFIN